MKTTILAATAGILTATFNLSAQSLVLQPVFAHRARIATELLANSLIGYNYTGVFSNRTDIVPSFYRTMLALEALSSATNITVSNLYSLNANVGNLTVTNVVTYGNILYTNTFWDDTQVPAISFKVGATAPTFGNFTDANIQCYRFVDTQDDTIYGSLQLSHRYKSGTTLKPHIHVAPMVAGTTNTVWWFYYSITNVNSAFPASTLVKVTNNFDGVAQYNHTIVSLGDIPNPAGRGSDVMLFTLIRKGTDAEDKDPADIAVVSFDLHFEIDKPGSDNEVP